MKMTSPTSSHQKGGLKELIVLFFPLLITTFMNCLFPAVEKLFLADYSTEAMEAAINASYACQIFQAPSTNIAMMALVCVGRWAGAKEWKTIGPGVWQFIWFSLLSMLVTVPGSLILGGFYFSGTTIEETALPYFYSFVGMNFLFPLAASLTCFYCGRGKMTLVLTATVATQVIRVGLTYLFIFGVDGWIPPLGVLGGCLGTLIAQGGFCALLLLFLLRPYNADLFQSRAWHFQPRLFWECLCPGGMRALGGLLNMSGWAFAAHLVAAKGGDYLLVLSVGGTFFLFFPFFGMAICQAQTTQISQILGAQDYVSLGRPFRSGSLLVLMFSVLVFVPLCLFPSATFHLLFPKVFLAEASIQWLFLGVWLSFVLFTFSFVPLSYVLAFKNTGFMVVLGTVAWLNVFLIYIALEIVKISANQFWLVMSLNHAIAALLYFFRMKALQSKVVLQHARI